MNKCILANNEIINIDEMTWLDRYNLYKQLRAKIIFKEVNKTTLHINEAYMLAIDLLMDDLQDRYNQEMSEYYGDDL